MTAVELHQWSMQISTPAPAGMVEWELTRLREQAHRAVSKVAGVPRDEVPVRYAERVDGPLPVCWEDEDGTVYALPYERYVLTLTPKEQGDGG